MRPIVLICVIALCGCSSLSGLQEPSSQEMKTAYAATDDVNLGTSLLGGMLELSEFKKIDCIAGKEDMFRCKFYAKFGLKKKQEGGEDIISGIIGSGSGFFREAIFFRNESGSWICTDVQKADNVEFPSV